MAQHAMTRQRIAKERGPGTNNTSKKQGQGGGGSPPRGKGRKQGKDWTNVSGGFHPAKRGPLPDPRPQVFGGGGEIKREKFTSKERGRGNPGKLMCSGGFSPREWGPLPTRLLNLLWRKAVLAQPYESGWGLQLSMVNVPWLEETFNNMYTQYVCSFHPSHTMSSLLYKVLFPSSSI
jgi:hypothetical protein